MIFIKLFLNNLSRIQIPAFNFSVAKVKSEMYNKTNIEETK